MIWQLTREQLRSQKGYVAWTAAMLTLTIAAATFGALTVATQQRANELSYAALGQDGPWHLGVDAWANTRGSDMTPTLDTVDAAIRTASTDGSDVAARRTLTLTVTTGANAPQPPPDNVEAITGDVAWDQILVDGTPPETGQIAVSAQYAQEHELGIGSTVSLSTPSSRFPSDLTVSGLTHSPVTQAGFTSWPPSAYVAWEDSAALSVALSPDDSAGATQVWTQLSWTNGDPALDSLITGATGNPYYNENLWTSNASPSATKYAAIVGLALLLGLVAMSFALGRSQAQARSRWVATARTLGARRRTIAAATVAETILVGTVASAVGIVLGYLATSVSLTMAHSNVVAPALPEQVWAPRPVLAGALALGLLIAAVIGANPAFWAARVSPVAALKPVSDITEAEVSRHVSSQQVFSSWIATVAGLVFLKWLNPDDGTLQAITLLLAIAAVVLGVAVLVDMMRITMKYLGLRLSRSARPWAITAGDALYARPRLAAIPAFIMASLVASLVAVVINSYVDGYFLILGELGGYHSGWFAYASSGAVRYIGPMLAMIVTGMLVVALTTLAIAASAKRAVGADAATREALGLTPGAARLSAAVQYSLPLVVGVAVGWLVGGCIYLWTSGIFWAEGFTNSWTGDQAGAGDLFRAVVSTTVPVLVVIACGLATAAIVGGVVALTARTSTPVKQLHHASR